MLGGCANIVMAAVLLRWPTVAGDDEGEDGGDDMPPRWGIAVPYALAGAAVACAGLALMNYF